MPPRPITTAKPFQPNAQLDLAKWYYEKAKKQAEMKFCYSAEVIEGIMEDFSSALKVMLDWFQILDTLHQHDTEAEALFNPMLMDTIEFVNRIMKDCRDSRPSGFDEFVEKINKFQGAPMDKMKKKDNEPPRMFATDANEQDRALRQRILDKRVYNVCTFGTFEDYAGGKDFQRLFEKEILNPLLYPNLGSKSNLISGIFIYGPPGTGKSALASIVVGYLTGMGQPPAYWEISAGDIKTRYVGDSEKAIKMLFEEAIKVAKTGQTVVIFMDEFDGLISEEEKSLSVLGEFKSQMQSTAMDPEVARKIVVIAASNYPEKIPVDALSRFPKKIYIGTPGYDETRWLLRKNFSNFGWQMVNFNYFAPGLLRTDDAQSDKSPAVGRSIPNPKGNSYAVPLAAQRIDMERDRFIFSQKCDAMLEKHMKAGQDAQNFEKYQLLRDFMFKSFNDSRKYAAAEKLGFYSLSGKIDDQINLVAGGPNDPKNRQSLVYLADKLKRSIAEYMTSETEEQRDEIKKPFQSIFKTQSDLVFDFCEKYMDVLDIMTLLAKLNDYTPRELNIVLKDTRNEAGARMRYFIEGVPDSGKRYYNKMLINKRKITESKTLYTENKCISKKIEVVEIIPLHRSTFREQEFMTEKGEIYDQMDAYMKAKEKALGSSTKKGTEFVVNSPGYEQISKHPDFEFLERIALQTKALPTENENPDQARLGYLWGLKFNTKDLYTYIAPKVYTHVEKPKEEYCKIVVTRKVLRNTEKVATAYRKGEQMPKWVEDWSTVRHYKAPVSAKEIQEDTVNKMLNMYVNAKDKQTAINTLKNTFFTTLPKISSEFIMDADKPAIEALAESFESPVKQVLQAAIKGENDVTIAKLKFTEAMYDIFMATKPFIPTAEEAVTRETLAKHITTCQIRLADFLTAFNLVKPPLIKNAQKMIDWAGGDVEKITILSDDPTPKYELKEIADRTPKPIPGTF